MVASLPKQSSASSLKQKKIVKGKKRYKTTAKNPDFQVPLRSQSPISATNATTNMVND